MCLSEEVTSRPSLSVSVDDERFHKAVSCYRSVECSHLGLEEFGPIPGNRCLPQDVYKGHLES